MALFFFNVYNNDVTIDEDGQDLPDVEAAREEAVRSARSLICDHVREGEVTLSHRIEVVDDGGRSIFTLTYGDVLRINP